MGYCSSCGSPVPDGQSSCSMCYGDIGYGSDGYYEEYMREYMRECMKQDEQGKLIELRITPNGNYSDCYECVLTAKENFVEFAITEPQYKSNPILTGYIKWDGCMELHGGFHICSIQQLKAINQLIVEVYQKSYELMDENADRSAFFDPVYTDLPF